MTVQWLWVMVRSWVLLCTSYCRSCADISKYDDGKRFIWESQADGAFAIFLDRWDKPFGQGAGTKLPLNEEAGEYIEEAESKELVKKIL